MKVELLDVKPTKKDPNCIRFSLRLYSDSGETLIQMNGLRFYPEMQEVFNVQMRLGYKRSIDLTELGGSGKPKLKEALGRLLDEADGDIEKLATLRTIVWP